MDTAGKVKHIHDWALDGTPNMTRIYRKCKDCGVRQGAVREWPPTVPASLEHLSAQNEWKDPKELPAEKTWALDYVGPWGIFLTETPEPTPKKWVGLSSTAGLQQLYGGAAGGDKTEVLHTVAEPGLRRGDLGELMIAMELAALGIPDEDPRPRPRVTRIEVEGKISAPAPLPAADCGANETLAALRDPEPPTV